MAEETQAAGEEAQTTTGSPLDELLSGSFKPNVWDQNGAEIKDAVKDLCSWVVDKKNLVSEDALETIEGVIAEIDRKLSEQVRLIMHHADFTKLEGSWRGLEHLVDKTETGAQLKIKVINLSKNELKKNLWKGSKWDQSPLFKKVYAAEFDQFGGHPYGCLLGDYEFDHSPMDVEILTGVAKVAAAAHAPFISAASPDVMGMETWQQLNDKRDIAKVFDPANPEYLSWNSLRQNPDSMYLGLTMPRFLSRIPYGSNTNPVDEFNFEEFDFGSEETINKHEDYVWSNAAYAMAANITRSFALYGWTTCIRGVENGGMVEDLPVHTFPTDDGSVDMKCPTEIAVGERREHELSHAGFLPLAHWKNTDYSVFIGGQSLNKPQEYMDPDATANAQISARLPYMFACCRFAHFLKSIVRDKIGSFKERADMERWLGDWIQNYCIDDPGASDRAKAERPLQKASVGVEEIPGNPGYYKAKFHLRPHFMLEGIDIDLSLVSKLPSGEGG